MTSSTQSLARGRRFHPARKQAFNLPAMTRISIGPAWTQIPPADQQALVRAFSDWSIATFAGRFDGFSGESFQVLGNTELRVDMVAGSTPNTTWFHYTADFSFGEPGKKAKTFKNVGSFTLLPNEETPAIVFVGIDGDHKSAMFFISDPAFEADGEGDCNAKGAECRFVYRNRHDKVQVVAFAAEQWMRLDVDGHV